MTLRYQRPWSSPSSDVRVAPRLVIGLATAAGAMLLANLGQLGYDEAVYAAKARSYVSDIPADWFELYRPPGLALFGTLAAEITGLCPAGVQVLADAAGVELGTLINAHGLMAGPTDGNKAISHLDFAALDAAGPAAAAACT